MEEPRQSELNDRPSRPRVANFGMPEVPAATAKPSVLLALSDTGLPSESLARARALADDIGAALHLVRVLPEAEGAAPRSARRTLPELLRSVERTLFAHRTTRDWMRSALPEGRGVERFAILHGEFVDRVAVYAREVEAQLILVAPREEDAGELVTQLAEATRTPVLVARAPAKNQTIIAATDLQDPEYPVLNLAAALGRQLETSVIAVHNFRLDAASPEVGQGAAGGAGQAESARAERLARLEQASRHLPTAARALVRHDDDHADAILEAARAEEADLVVVGTRRRAWFERFPSGNVASRVVDRAQRSVLVTPVGEVADAPMELAWG